MAKDIAALANLYGGSLVIGVHLKAGVVQAYKHLTPQEAAVQEAGLRTAVQQRCRPGPSYSTTMIPQSAGVLLVVNVEPSIPLVAVRVSGDKADGYGDPTWVFPRRLGSGTSYITPENLAMYMVPDVRRK